MVPRISAILTRLGLRRRFIVRDIAWLTLIAAGLMVGITIARSRNAADDAIANQSPEGAGYGRVMAAVHLDQPTLRQALSQLGRESHANLDIDWAQMQQDGVSLDSPLKVQFDLRNVTLDQVLPLLRWDRESYLFRFAAVGGRVVISSPLAEMDRIPTLLRIYDTRALLSKIRGKIETYPDDFFDTKGTGKPVEEAFLEKVVTDTAVSDSWISAGGTRGTLDFSGGYMLVVQTDNGHEEVAKALHDLGNDEPSSKLVIPKFQNRSQAEAELRRSVGNLSLNRAPVQEVIARLKDRTNANVFINWARLSKYEIMADTLVDLTLHDATLERAMDELVKRLNATRSLEAGVDWDIRDGIITLSSSEDLGNRGAYVVVYPADDLLQKLRAAGSKDSDRDLAERVRKAVSSAGWMDAVEKRDARVWAGRLIVMQNTPNHRLIAQLLNEIRGGS